MRYSTPLARAAYHLAVDHDWFEAEVGIPSEDGIGQQWQALVKVSRVALLTKGEDDLLTSVRAGREVLVWVIEDEDGFITEHASTDLDTAGHAEREARMRDSFTEYTQHYGQGAALILAALAGEEVESVSANAPVLVVEEEDEDFNPHDNRTADGVLITRGLRVFTNNFDRGRIIGKDHDGDGSRRNQWWWYVELDTDYLGRDLTGLDPRRVVSMNGERMATRDRGENA